MRWATDKNDNCKSLSNSFVDDDLSCCDMPGLLKRSENYECDSQSTEDDAKNFILPNWEDFGDKINGVVDHTKSVGIRMAGKPGKVVRVMLDSGSTIHAAVTPVGIQNREECPDKKFEMANGSLSGAPFKGDWHLETLDELGIIFTNTYHTPDFT